MTEILPAAEATELAECEQVIERGLKTFVEVGQALLRIRDGQLYRASHATFEDYCQVRWQLGRSHAYRLMDASETMAALSPIGDTPPPANEAQARALAPLRDDPALMTQAWQHAMQASDGKPTARMVGAVVDAIRQAAKIEARGGRGSGPDRICTGCVICHSDPGIITHYACTGKPSAGRRRAVYIDGHGITYDHYRPEAEVQESAATYANALVLNRRLPSGEEYTEIRVPPGPCGIPDCPACAAMLPGHRLAGDIEQLITAAAGMLVTEAEHDAANAELLRIRDEWQHMLDKLAEVARIQAYEAVGYGSLREWVESTGYLAKLLSIMAEGPGLAGIQVAAELADAMEATA